MRKKTFLRIIFPESVDARRRRQTQTVAVAPFQIVVTDTGNHRRIVTAKAQRRENHLPFFLFGDPFAVFVDSRMKVFLSLLISCFVLSVSAADGSTSWPALSQGQSCMARSFIGMPESLTPYISSSMREDMIDFFAVGSKKGVTNLLMGESSVEEITDCSITVKLASDKSVLSIRKYIFMTDRYLICLLIASKLSELITCSILHASSAATSGLTPSLSNHEERSVCRS